MHRRRIEVPPPPTRGRIYEDSKPAPEAPATPAQQATSTKKMELVQMKVTRADGSVEIKRAKQSPGD